MSKYFFVAYTGTVLQSISGANVPEEFSQMLGRKDGKIPHTIQGNDIIESPSDKFIPTEIERFLKFKGRLDECKIMFVREMSVEEAEAEKKAVVELLKPPEIPLAIQSEIDYLINASEQGNLRVNVDPKSEKPIDDDDGFGGLFEKPFNWKD